MNRIFFILMLMIFPLVGLQAEENNAVKSKFVYDSHGKKDPFAPLVNSSGIIVIYDSDLSVTDMVVEGIMLGDDGNAIAIVNGKVVKIGDKMGEFVVEALEKDHIIFSKGEEKFELKLKKKGD